LSVAISRYSDHNVVATFWLWYSVNYVKKDKEPNWDDLPQVKPYWEEFKQYKLFEDAQEKSDQAKKNAANKKCSHHLGASGRSKVVRKWKNTEHDFMDRSILARSIVGAYQRHHRESSDDARRRQLGWQYFMDYE
jgi:hypothetical protein